MSEISRGFRLLRESEPSVPRPTSHAVIIEPGSGIAGALTGACVVPVNVVPIRSRASKVTVPGAKAEVNLKGAVVVPGAKVGSVSGSASSKNETIPTPGSKLMPNPMGAERLIRLLAFATGTLTIARSNSEPAVFVTE